MKNNIDYFFFPLLWYRVTQFFFLQQSKEKRIKNNKDKTYNK